MPNKNDLVLQYILLSLVKVFLGLTKIALISVASRVMIV